MSVKSVNYLLRRFAARQISTSIHLHCSEYLGTVQQLPGGWGVGKPEEGHRGKSQLERGGLDVKFNNYRGGITFFTLFHKLEKW